MHFVKTEDLCPGMRLAKPIYNRLGVLLYERNTELTPQGINSIRKFSDRNLCFRPGRTPAAFK